MLLFILLRPVLFLQLERSITSETSVIGTPPSSIALRMHLHDKWRDLRSWKRRLSIQRSAKQRMITGRSGIRQRKMVLDADADVTPISKMLKGSKDLVCPNGWMLLEDGQALDDITRKKNPLGLHRIWRLVIQLD